MKRKYYIAYGGNMSLPQMAIRCPNAKLIGKGKLADWCLVFKSYADIERRKGSYVPVLVWSITRSDEQALDTYEGYPYFYGKENLSVDVDLLDQELNSTGYTKRIKAMVYIMKPGTADHLPFKSYINPIIKAYTQFNFDILVLANAILETTEKITAKNEKI